MGVNFNSDFNEYRSLRSLISYFVQVHVKVKMNRTEHLDGETFFSLNY